MFVFTLLAMFSVAWTFKTFDVATLNKITAVEDTVYRLLARVKALEALEAYINISGKAEASMTSLAGRVNALELEVKNMHSFKYVGCYRDSWARALYFRCHTTQLTTEKCRMCCLDRSFSYFGTEDRLQCFCGDDIRSGNKKVDDAECAYPCAGDVQDRCGGNWAISIYQM